MKLVYEDGEKERIKEMIKTKEEAGLGTLFGLHDSEKVYGLTFKVTDPAIAEYILLGQLYNKLEDLDLRIDVISVDFVDVATQKDRMKDRLYAAIEDIIG